MTNIHGRTNTEWTSEIAVKIAAVESDTSKPDYGPEHVPPHVLAKLIDHTLLKPDSTEAQIDQLCEETKAYGFKSCCINGSHVNRVAANLEGSDSVVACVIGFPLGAMHTTAKVFEAKTAIANGARELDAVIPIGQLKSHNYAAVYEDVVALRDAATQPVVLKIIIETALLTPAEIIAASFIAAEAGADYVKTCTGFNGGQATVQDVVLMRKTAAYKSGQVKVKASGGVRSRKDVLDMVRAGAERIGTSSGVSIMREATSVGDGIHNDRT